MQIVKYAYGCKFICFLLFVRDAAGSHTASQQLCIIHKMHSFVSLRTDPTFHQPKAPSQDIFLTSLSKPLSPSMISSSSSLIQILRTHQDLAMPDVSIFLGMLSLTQTLCPHCLPSLCDSFFYCRHGVYFAMILVRYPLISSGIFQQFSLVLSSQFEKIMLPYSLPLFLPISSNSFFSLTYYYLAFSP